MNVDEIRSRLEQDLTELRADVVELEREDDQDSGREISDLPTHHADATPEYEAEQVATGVEADLTGRMSRIEAALNRIDDGTYGICITCGQPIENERLQARPDAERCLKDERQAEEAYLHDNTARQAGDTAAATATDTD